MEKILVLFASLFMSVSCWAGCTGGHEITTTRGDFCVSDFGMNWWTAHAWCQGNGGQLASIAEACGLQGGCTNLKGKTTSAWSGYVWLSNPSGSSYAYFVYLSSGDMSNGFGRDYNFAALCVGY